MTIFPYILLLFANYVQLWCYRAFHFLITGSGAVALAHLDGSGTAEAAAAMVARVQQLAVGYPEGRLELQLVGGFRDPHNYSDELFANIMRE